MPPLVPLIPLRDSIWQLTYGYYRNLQLVQK